MDTLNLNGLMNTISAVLIGATIIISAAWIITSLIAAMRQRANTRTRAEIYNKLIDKFGTAPEFVEFLTSDAGLKFIDEQAVETSQPLARILSSMRLGVTFALIGLGMIVVGNIWDQTLGESLWVVLAMGGTVALAAGAGFIIAAAVSYRICVNLGLIRRPEPENSKAD